VPDFLGLLLADPALYVQTGTALQTVFGQVTESNDAFAAATGGMPGWHGDARTAQDARAKSIGSEATTAAQAVERAGQALITGGTEMTEATMMLRGQVDMILAEGYLVLASGLVVIGPAQEAEAAAATVAAEAVIAGYEAGAVAYTAELDLIIEGATTIDVETAGQLQAAGAMVGLAAPGPSPLRGSGPAATAKVWYENGMPKGEFARKARALKDLSNRDLLFKASNPVERDKSVTDGYRSFVIGRIRRLYNTTNPGFRDSLIDNVAHDMSPDHVWELQIGGPDRRSGLRFLDRFTNERIGTRQIWPQIQNLPDGTPIQIEVSGFE
jgi:hypothetical protein